MSEVTENVVKAITEEPTIFEVATKRGKVGSFLAKIRLLPRVRRFYIYPVTLGMSEQMKECSENITIGEVATVGEAFVAAGNNSRTTARWLAVALIRSSKPAAESEIKKLAAYLHHNLTAESLTLLVSVVVKRSNISFFLSTMNLVAGKESQKNQEK